MGEGPLFKGGGMEGVKKLTPVFRGGWPPAITEKPAALEEEATPGSGDPDDVDSRVDFPWPSPKSAVRREDTRAMHMLNLSFQTLQESHRGERL